MAALWDWIVEHWEFVVGSGLGALGIAVAIAAVIYQRRPKQLDYEIRSDIQILSSHAKDMPEGLEVTYGGTTIDDPRIVILRIRNTGKVGISEADFAGSDPIELIYEQNHPFGADVVAASKGLSITGIAKVKYGDEMMPKSERSEDWSRIYAMPRLLNPGEWFDLQLRSDGPHGKVAAVARFADQTRPMKDLSVPDLARRRRFLMIAGIVVLVTNILGTQFVAFALGDAPLNKYEIALLVSTLSTLVPTLTLIVVRKDIAPYFRSSRVGSD